MALPRFHRLPADTKAALLAVARAHFARDGKDGASFNRIISEAGISKTSAYHYFDGKDDLFDEVVADAAARTLAALGPWNEAETEDELWRQVADAHTRLVTQLREHPEDRAVLAGQPHGHRDGHAWVRRLVDNGRRIGIVGPEVDAELVTVATIGVLEAFDAWALERPEGLDRPSAESLTLLLTRLWR
ncbi:TetR/AcrR family transcriptional regulator [Streptomyces katsurahamanus]|uniref:TetR/AcrR family transcriptional regulator n=1 Tax=Streptomyces katsurahamanus TaxID=2577098 RepID=A0ABW9NWU2_9ACTN|nr:TetR/AcrR family transcriptional regulator [Streptomyces katsurahamanus]MQS37790.1 TetR/AcrR family transcriptional regulator [Streptomyces katsurahamanus]